MYFGGICAGGKGVRFGGDTPKQFLLYEGKPIIAYSVETMLSCPHIQKVFAAVPSDYADYCRELFKDEKKERIEIIEGGSSRSETVALLTEKALEIGKGSDIMITHDAARPFVSAETFMRCAEAAEKHGVSGTALPAFDTVFRCKDGFICAAPPREEMFLAQTPQCFRIELFTELWNAASDKEKDAATDACGMFFRAGIPVKMVEGDHDGGKLTVREDLERLCRGKRK